MSDKASIEAGKLLLRSTSSMAYLDIAVALVELTAAAVMKAVEADPDLEPEGSAILRGLQDSTEAMTRAARFIRERSKAQVDRGPKG